MGDYLVTSPSTVFTFTGNTTENISSATQFMKHGMSDNNASADNLGENIGTRLQTFYDNNVLFTRSGTTVSTSADQFRVVLPDGTYYNKFKVDSQLDLHSR